jgi:hypothetical protein
MAKEHYKCIQKMMEIIMTHNAVIFGGAVRDKVLHDLHARAFYLTNCIDYASGFQQFDGRFIIPNDIDCYMLRSDFMKFLEFVLKRYFITYEKVPFEYINKNCTGNYTMYKIKVLDLIKIDCIVQDDPPPLAWPSLCSDYNVNSLLLTSTGMYNNPLFKMDYSSMFNLFDIMARINRKQAYGKAWVDLYRHLKMIDAGWHITLEYCHLDFTTDSYKGTCLICHESGFNFENMVKYKQCECDLRYCLPCIRKNISQLINCPLCKENVIRNSDEAMNELLIYSHILDMNEKTCAKKQFSVALRRWRRSISISRDTSDVDCIPDPWLK